MRVRLVHITTRRSGNKAVREEQIDVEVLAAGRASDNPVFVPGLTVALRHAAFHLRGGEVWVETVDGDDLRINQHVSDAGRVSPGDVVYIGNSELRVLEIEGDEDFALEIEEVERKGPAAAELAKRTRLGIKRGWFREPPLSWSLFVIVLGLFGVVPWLVSNDEAGDATSIGMVRRLTASWSSGPLSAHHAPISADCVACHAQGFEPVADTSCLEAACHAEIGSHGEAANVAHTFSDTRCADCHLEHNGELALAAFGDDLCTDCHENLAAVNPNADLADAGDFATTHPGFRPAVVVDPATGERRRGSRPRETPEENSGLRFPHATHLKAGLRGLDDPATPLQCGDCHQPDMTGRLMAPVDFETHCESCHSLAFDSADPNRQAPHGEPQFVRLALAEFYARRALGGVGASAEAEQAPRRRPGTATGLLAERRSGIEAGDEGFASLTRWVDRQSTRAADRMLKSDGGCAECHTIDTVNGAPVVTPVRVVPFAGAERWMPLVDFDHAAHDIPEPSRDMPAADCDTCHAAARTADSAGAVLMPTIETCRECHAGGQPSFRKITSPCILCHDFHMKKHGPWAAGEAMAAHGHDEKRS